MDPLDPQFDDPALRAAVKRALGGESAPPQLRHRISDALRRETKATPARWRNPVYALAAMVLIGVGVALWLNFSSEKEAPQWFAIAMSNTHDQCSKLPDHHLLAGITSDDPAAVRATLTGELKYPVFVPAPGDGWKFDGAGKCRVGVTDAAHLLFTRGDETISVFSVRKTVLGSYIADSDANYAQIEDGHAIAGFVEGGVIHCLVGTSKSGNLILKDVIRLRDQWRAAYGANLSHASG